MVRLWWYTRFLQPALQTLALPHEAGRSLNSTAVSIVGYDHFFNPNQQLLTVEWEVFGCREHILPEYPIEDPAGPIQCGPLDLPVDIYLNDASNKVLSYTPNDLPVDPIRGPQLIRELVTFRTEHEFHPSGHPAESYVFRACVFAIDPATNASVDIARFSTANSLNGLTISSHGTPVAGESACSATDGRTALEIEYRHTEPSGASTAGMLVTSWVLTLVSVCTTGMAMTKERIDLIILAIHAFIALVVLGLWEWGIGKRAFGSYPGLLGFYLQIGTVIFCSMLLLLLVAKPSKASWQPEKA